MNSPTRIRRCSLLLVEPRERLDLDVAALLAGGRAIKRTRYWVALAPHLDEETEVDIHELNELEAVGKDWIPFDENFADAPLRSLLKKGLVLGDHDAHAGLRERDERLDSMKWFPPAAINHYFGRWEHVGEGEVVLVTRYRSMRSLIDAHGPPPSHELACSPAADRTSLPLPSPTYIDDILHRRATCRNFDREAMVELEPFSAVLHRVAGALAAVEMAPDAWLYKKAHPSGGGLHPTECYLLIRGVRGIAPGLYHYHPGDHALEPIATPQGHELGALASSFVAGQHYFAEAQVQIAFVARFRRIHWKYRHHPKVYRALLLEAGHMAQNLYMAATEAGLGAWITAAINEKTIEQAFGLDAIEQSPLAMCGFGIRAREKHVIEFDPLHRVWPESDDERPIRVPGLRAAGPGQA